MAKLVCYEAEWLSAGFTVDISIVFYGPRSKYTIKTEGQDPISFGDVGGASPVVLSVFNDLYIVGVYTRIHWVVPF